MKPLVALARDPAATYPGRAPFNPDTRFPEMAAAPWAASIASEPNAAYALVRECLRHLGFDHERFGTSAWNPLETIVAPGSRVVIKPNFVLHERESQRGRHCLVTHVSVLRAIIDYVLLAGGPTCRVAIVDAPLQQAEFDTLLRDSGLDEVVAHFRETAGVELETIDLRRTRVEVDEHRIIRAQHSLAGDPRGYVVVRLDASSALDAITSEDTQFAVTDYDRAEMTQHHGRGRHEYLISRSVLEADTFINVPKLKTHQKVGVTLALKNLVGINGSKDWLPHYRPGAPASGGDEFPARSVVSSLHSRVRSALQGRSPMAMRTAQTLWHAYRRLLEPGRNSGDQETGNRTLSGAWHGNDTTWRMVLDLNRALFHASSDGTLGPPRPFRYLAFIDGIVGGEGDGPLSPQPRSAGLVAASEDPVALDRVCAAIMGLDPDRMPMLREAINPSSFPVTGLDDSVSPDVRSSSTDWPTWNLKFKPAPGWVGHVEKQASENVQASAGA